MLCRDYALGASSTSSHEDEILIVEISRQVELRQLFATSADAFAVRPYACLSPRPLTTRAGRYEETEDNCGTAVPAG